MDEAEKQIKQGIPYLAYVFTMKYNAAVQATCTQRAQLVTDLVVGAIQVIFGLVGEAVGIVGKIPGAEMGAGQFGSVMGRCESLASFSHLLTGS